MAPGSFNEGSSALNDDGNRYVAMLNANDRDRILNDNWVDNDLNDSDRVLLVRQSLHVKEWFDVCRTTLMFTSVSANLQSCFRFQLAERIMQQIFYDPRLQSPRQSE